MLLLLQVVDVVAHASLFPRCSKSVAQLGFGRTRSSVSGEIVEEEVLEMGLRIIRRRIEKDAKLRSVILHLWVKGGPEGIRVAQERLVMRGDISGFYID
jgi:hypothetical protein